MTTATKPRAALQKTWNYPPQLPVSQAREAILAALKAHQVLILCGATGSGKSTQLPKFCLEAGLGTKGLIAHTQPRRLAARALAERVAEEIGESAGETIGWQVRFKAVLSETTRVKLMTDGVLLNEMRRDRLLKRYDTIIIDEAHERSLNIDFLLGYLRRIQHKRRDLKIIITSATLDAEKFSKHFDNAPVIEVPGKSYPISLRYEDPQNADIAEFSAQTVAKLWKQASGDVLIFLPGEAEIREMAAHLSDHPRLSQWAPQILPLFARLGSARQQAIFHPGKQRRIVLATNVAETSLTVPGIAHVIDTGTARVSRYNPRSKIQNLQIEPIAQANADQRKGRCGRTGPGICVRLYSEDDFEARPRFTEPEIQRTNLASVVLQMADLGLGDAEDFPFIDPPHKRYLNDARRLLEQLQAFKPDGRLNKTGRALAHLPLDPRMGKILLSARALNCEELARPIVAALSMQDPRERDADNRQKSDQAQSVFKDPQSDFISLLNLWTQSLEQKHVLSNSEYRRWCQKHYLNARRMQEWRDLHKQIRSESHREESNKLPNKNKPAREKQEIPRPALHQALLSGLLDHIARHEDKGEYRGPRNASWRIHPESALIKKSPAWMVAGEIVHTRRVYARCVAKVEPAWIEKAAAHLLQRTALEPSWNMHQGRVVAREQISLFGMVLSTDRLVPYARYDADHARQIFIEQALLGKGWGRTAMPAFLKANQALIKRLQAEENKTRRRDLLKPDEDIIAWYQQHLPPKVCDRQGLLEALKKLSDDALKLREQDVRLQANDNLDSAFPSRFELAGQALKLSYVFDPGSAQDGVNLRIPIEQLNQLSQQHLDWLVPGLLADKIEHLLKSLPKAQRRRFVPVNEAVQRCEQALEFRKGDFYAQLARQLQRICGSQDPTDKQLREINLPERLKMRVLVLDSKGKQLANGRELASLKSKLGEQARQAFDDPRDSQWQIKGLKDWEPDRLPDPIPETVTSANGLIGWPCFVDADDTVELGLLDDPDKAAATHKQGLLKLLWLAQRNRLKPRLKGLPNRQKIELQLSALPASNAETRHLLRLLAPSATGNETVSNCIGLRAISTVQLDVSIRSQQQFSQALEQSAALASEITRLWKHVTDIAAAWSQWHDLKPISTDSAASTDIQTQLEWLMAPGWPLRSADLANLPRYLQALCHRVERYPLQPGADAERQVQVGKHWDRMLAELNDCAKRGVAAGEALISYRWMIEEFRVSLFAQQLGTQGKISAKRLDQQWLKVQSER